MGFTLTPWSILRWKRVGERDLLLCSSQRYSNGSGNEARVVILAEGPEVTICTNGKAGSGVYSIDDDGDAARLEVLKVLAIEGLGIQDVSRGPEAWGRL